jgi:type II secretory pathway pseudopilin PulG
MTPTIFALRIRIQKLMSKLPTNIKNRIAGNTQKWPFFIIVIGVVAVLIGSVVYQYCFVTAAVSKETIELHRLKAFGGALLRYIENNQGEFPKTLKQLEPFINPTRNDIVFYHDIKTGKRIAWWVIIQSSTKTRSLIAASPLPYISSNGKEKRLAIFSDGSAFIMENTECISLIQDKKIVQLK